MWKVMLLFGFIIAITPTLAYGIWNGMSLLGLVLCLLSGGFILREEMDR